MAEATPPEVPAQAIPAKTPGFDFMGAFKFLLSDANALNNLLIGAVMNIIPIIGPITLMGWHCEIVQRLIKRHPRPIPKLDFSDFLYFLGRGVAPFVVVLIATLPITLLVMFLMFVLMFGLALVGSTMHQQNGEPPAALIFGGIGIAFLLFFMLMLVINVVVMSALTRAELTEDIGKSLSFSHIWAYAKATWKDVIIAYIVFLPLATIVMFGGMLVVFVGIYAAIIFINVTYVHLRWQIYERYLSRGGEPIPIQTKSGPLPSESRPAAPPAAAATK